MARAAVFIALAIFAASATAAVYFEVRKSFQGRRERERGRKEKNPYGTFLTFQGTAPSLCTPLSLFFLLTWSEQTLSDSFQVLYKDSSLRRAQW